MSDCEGELLRIIRESKDPAKALVVAVDILLRCVAGESMDSIADSYGLRGVLSRSERCLSEGCNFSLCSPKEQER